MARFFEIACRNVRYPHFNWIVVWTVTRACNLRCKYCPVAYAAHNPEGFRKGTEFLEKEPPKMLILHGGEPVLVDGLVDALKRIREKRPDIYILLETNATLPEKVKEVLPYIDHIEASMDALGDINRRVRGVDGDIIFENIRHLFNAASAEGKSLVITAVVTIENYRHLDSLIEAGRSLKKDLQIGFFVMHPKTNPLSVRHDSEVWEEFKGVIRDLRNRYPENVRYKGETSTSQKMRCFAQFFISHLMDDGTLYRCKSQQHIDIFRRKQFGGKGLKRVLEFGRQTAHLADILLLRKMATMCYRPCDWGLPLMAFFTAKNREGFEKFAGWPALRGMRMDRGEERRLVKFMKRYVNPGFDAAWLEALKGGYHK